MKNRVGRSEMTLNYQMIVERYPNPGCEVSSMPDENWRSGQLPLILCFDVGMSTFCLEKRNERRIELMTLQYDTMFSV
jgi:hypothetical protein